MLLWPSPGSYHKIPKFVNEEKDISKIEDFMENFIIKAIKNVGDSVYAWDVMNELIMDG